MELDINLTVMLMKLIVCLLGIVVSVPVDKRHFMRFLELSELLQDSTEGCEIKTCTQDKFELDGIGLTWSRFCYICIDSQVPLLFRREYTQHGWTYLTSKEEGKAEYSYRIIEHITNCSNSVYELDGQGREWRKWCYADGEPVMFQRSGEQSWTYVEDYDGGFAKYGWRRVVSRTYPVMIEQDNDEESYIQELERNENQFLELGEEYLNEDFDEDLDEDLMNVIQKQTLDLEEELREAIEEKGKEITERLENDLEQEREQIEIALEESLTQEREELETEIEIILDDKAEDLDENLEEIQEDIEKELGEVEKQIQDELQQAGDEIQIELEQIIEEAGEQLQEQLEEVLEEALEDKPLEDVAFLELEDYDDYSNFIQVDSEYTGEDWESVIYTVTEEYIAPDNTNYTIHTKYSATQNKPDIHTHQEDLPCWCDRIEDDKRKESEEGIEVIETLEVGDTSDISNIQEMRDQVEADENVAALENTLQVVESVENIENLEVVESLENIENLQVVESVENIESSDVLHNSSPSEEIVPSSELSTLDSESLENPISPDIPQNPESSPIITPPSHNIYTDTDFSSKPSLPHKISLHPISPSDIPSLSSSDSSIQSLDKLLTPPPYDCHILESDISGRYFWQEYDESGSPVSFSKDSLGNYIWDSASNSRLILRSNSFLEIIPKFKSSSKKKPACPVYNGSGQQIDFEKDEYFPFFWEIVLDHGSPIQFAKSTKEDHSQGMYRLDSLSGLRMRDFN
jgi:hypothetical protein